MCEEKNIIKVDSDTGESAFVLCCFITFWITIEDPDIIDAIIHFLMK